MLPPKIDSELQFLPEAHLDFGVALPQIAST
jgi:hypothetical protein